MSNNNFAHLHVHTCYSLLDGSNKIKDYVKRIKELGMTAGAITDHGAMYGVIEFYKAMKAEGLNPVLGCEVYVAPGSRFDKKNIDSDVNAENDARYNHLVLLAENNKGYENLVKIVSAGFTDGFYYKPRVDFEILEKYHEGIIALSACLAGTVPREIVRGNYEKAKEQALKHISIFGKDNYFLELQDHGIPDEKAMNTGLIRLSKELGVGLVATNDCHYTLKEDAASHDVLLCIQTGKTISDPNRMKYDGGQYYVKSKEEMEELFPYAKEAIENTQKIANRCHVEIEFHKTKMPAYPIPEGYDTLSYLQKLCYDGLKERYPNDDGTVKKQLDYELSVINNMGYTAYFLIVWDFINYCRENGIPVGPGRGSAAGSIVSYCLHITNLDPVHYGLLFERFLNPERVSMPDIDVDFCYVRRPEVIEYVKEKYGYVAQIITFGTMAARMVIKDVARAMEIPYSTSNYIANMIPKEVNITIEKALEMNPEFKELYNSNEEAKNLIDMSLKLEGLPRQTGVHAAGVIISDRSLDEYIPIAKAKDGSIVSQFNMVEVEELGLLKMDFLGLRTLTVISDTIKNVKLTHGVDIDIDNINLADEDVLNYIGTGKTNGIFQLESGGMQSFMKQLKPKSIEDVIAGISLYRPGPMDFIPQYITGKNDPVNAVYECDELRPILSPTYGCIVYQEQVMQIVRELAGYTMGQADNIRRAMSKKKQYVIDAERKNFIYGNEEEKIVGCLANGIKEEAANKIYDSMTDFAKYAFNKSHAACYAIVSYQTAYLKYYYPVEFMAALMTSVVTNAVKLTGYIQAGKSQGIELCPPDINESEESFLAKDGKIRFALCGIKGISIDVAQAITKNRETNGKYHDFKDTVKRFMALGVNKKGITNLIHGGAFDGFEGTRKQKATILDSVVESISAEKKINVEGQMSLFEMMGEPEKITMPKVGEYTKKQILELEKDVSGIYISGHPLDDHRELLEHYDSVTADKFMRDEEDDTLDVFEGQEVIIGGLVKSSKTVYTKKDNKPMMFFTLEDLYGEVEIVLFPKGYELHKDKIHAGNKVFVKGRVSTEEGKNASIMAEDVQLFENIPVKVWVRLSSESEYNEKAELLNKISTDHKGKDTLVVYITETNQRSHRLNSISAETKTLELLREKFGNDNIKITF